MDVEFITDGSYINWEKPTKTGAISTPISIDLMKAVVHCSMLYKEYIGLLGMTDSVELATT
jgi:hypothetical protein